MTAPRFIPACAGNSPRHQRRAAGSTGSSPRVRGTRVDGVEKRLRKRFIPACAGNSSRARRADRRAAVHPRVCGELVVTEHSDVQQAGSSPRVRGTRTSNGVRHRCHRFIPACAGNSSTIVWSVSAVPVHPRVCGELAKAACGTKPASGSSPRVRGTRSDNADYWLDGSGSSPRVRGTRGPNPRNPPPPPVHPRVCGELVPLAVPIA